MKINPLSTSPFDWKTYKTPFIFLSLAGLLMTAILLLHAYNGFFSRMMSDEYAIINLYRSEGFIGSFITTYTRFCGRFSLLVVYNLFCISGPGIIPFLTFAALTVWVLGMGWTISRLLQLFHLQENRWFSFFSSVTLIFVTLDITPNIFQSLYWTPGMFTYILPLIFMTYQAGLFAYFLAQEISSPRKKISRLLFFFLFSFIAAGFSETHAVMASCVFALASVTHFLWKKPRQWKLYRPFLSAGLAGTFLALALQFAAPGNHVRQTLFTPTTNPFTVIYQSIQFMITFSRDLLINHSLSVLIVFTVSIIFSSQIAALRKNRRNSTGEYSNPPVTRKKIFQRVCFHLLFVILGFLLVASCMAPSFYATSQPPLERISVIPIFVFVLVITYLGSLAGFFLPFIKQTSIILVFIVLGSVSRSFLHLTTVSHQMKIYAYTWEIREKTIINALKNGQTNVTVKPLKNCQMMIGLDEVSPDPGFWVNTMLAQYHGLKTVKLRKQPAVKTNSRKKTKPHKKSSKVTSLNDFTITDIKY